MGLFDSWRRKRETPTAVKLEKPAKTSAAARKSDVGESAEKSDDVINLVAEYEHLVKRREELKLEREELTVKLDNGELDANEVRQQLMNRIQEAAQVSENLRVTSARLTSLGYRGVLH